MPMPLWTPYAKEEALDLRKPAIKREPASPPPEQHSPSPTQGSSPESLRYEPSPEARHYAANPGAFPGVASPEQIRYGASPLQYQYVSPGRVQYPISPGRVQYPVSPVPQYYQYPTPVPQISPASGSNCSRYEDGAYANQAALSPPISPSAEKTKNFKDSLTDTAEFEAFERNALRAMALKNGGALLGNNPRMRRAVRSTNQNAADDSYKTQRQRNNFAAKQSRDRRKMREIHLALKVTYLGNLVTKLKAQLAARYCGRCQQPCECAK